MTTGQKIFGYIVQNPGKTSIEYLSLIGATGVKKGSITSYISQMLKSRVINKDVNGKLTPAVKSFKGFSKAPTIVLKKVIVKKAVKSSAATENLDVNDILNTLTISQAVALKKALNLMFKE